MRHSINNNELNEALEEISKFKWAKGYTCRNERCGHRKYYQGATPFSRRCTKCKKDESATANTVFAKLRMPIPVALELVRICCSYTTHRYSLQELQDHLKKTYSIAIDQRNIWSFMLKVYLRMGVPNIVYGLYAIVLNYDGIIISMGTINGKRRYIARKGLSIDEFVQLHTKVKTCVWAISLHGKKKIPKLEIVKDRRTTNVKLDFAESLYLGFKDIFKSKQHYMMSDDHAQSYLNLYSFIKNRGTYDELMKKLTNNN